MCYETTTPILTFPLGGGRDFVEEIFLKQEVLVKADVLRQAQDERDLNI